MSYKYKPIYWQRLCWMSFEHLLFQTLHCSLKPDTPGKKNKYISVLVDLDRAFGEYLWSHGHSQHLQWVPIKTRNSDCQVRWWSTLNGTRLIYYDVYGQLMVFLHPEPCTGAWQPTRSSVCVGSPPPSHSKLVTPPGTEIFDQRLALKSKPACLWFLAGCGWNSGGVTKVKIPSRREKSVPPDVSDVQPAFLSSAVYIFLLLNATRFIFLSAWLNQSLFFCFFF